MYFIHFSYSLFLCIDHQDDNSLEYIDQSTPSQPSWSMDQDTPSFLEYNDQVTPLPPSEWMDQGTPSFLEYSGTSEKRTPWGVLLSLSWMLPLSRRLTSFWPVNHKLQLVINFD